MDGLARRLEELGMISYLDSFVAEGFDTWNSLQNATEQDLEALGIPQASRQKLQHLISGPGIVNDTAEDSKQGRKRSMAGAGGPSSPGKVPRRKYKRHPKPDANAPERPLTAYVRFSKDKRKEYQERRLSFSELAKQIGIDWQDLSPATKNKYLSDASADWTNFRKALDDYHATSQYADYVQYLRDFANENPDSNVKLPQSDESGSPSHLPAIAWDAEGSPTSDDDTRPFGVPEPSPAHVSRDFDSGHSHYELEHENVYQPTFLTQDAMNQHTAMNPIQGFNYQSNMAFQGFTQPNFTDPWHQRQSLHLNTIGPNSRFSRTNTSLTQALHRASDTRAFHQRQHPQESSTDTTPTSDLSGRYQGSSSKSSFTTMPGHDKSAGQISAEGMYTSAMMPNNFAQSFSPAPARHGLPQTFGGHTQQHQPQMLQPRDNNSSMFEQAQNLSPSHLQELDSTFNVIFPDHNDIWASGLLEQDFISHDPSDTY